MKSYKVIGVTPIHMCAVACAAGTQSESARVSLMYLLSGGRLPDAFESTLSTDAAGRHSIA